MIGPSRRGYLDSSHGQLHYRCAGEGDAALVLLHQNANSSRMWEPVMSGLARGRRVIALDLPGCGASDPFPSRPSAGDYVDVVLGALDALGLERVALGGFHAGAGFAAMVATRAPARVDRLVLLGVPLFDEERRGALVASLGEVPSVVRDADGDYLVRLWEISSNPDPGVRERELTDRLLAGPQAWWSSAALFADDLRPVLRAVRCPALVLHAKKDFLAASQQEAAELLGNAQRIALVAEVLVADDRPDEVVAAVEAFLAG